MGPVSAWVALFGSVLVVLSYELRLLWRERASPNATARSAHVALRCAWVASLSLQPGSEMVAVQTLRNSLMSATITASTAAITLMGTLTLSANSVARELSLIAARQYSPRLVLELLLLLTLFASYVCSALAIRYFNHAGFVMSLPIGCEQRLERQPLAAVYLSRAGLLHSWGLRCFLFVAPLVAGLVNLYAMPVAAVALLLVLRAFDTAPRAPRPLKDT